MIKVLWRYLTSNVIEVLKIKNDITLLPANKEPDIYPVQSETISNNSIKIEFPLLSVFNYAKEKGKINLVCDNNLFDFHKPNPIDLAWRNSTSYPEPYIAELEDVMVISGARLIINSDGKALSDEIEKGFRTFGLRPKSWDMDLTEGPIIKLPQYEICEQKIPIAIHLTGEHEANYFHWVVELLPRLHLYEELAHENSHPIIVSDGLNKNLYELLDLVRSQSRSVIKINRAIWYKVERLVYPSDASRIFDVYDRAPDYDTTYIPVGLLQSMVCKIKPNIQLKEKNNCKRIYVRRNSSYRKLLNEDEVEAFLVENGFVTIDPGRMSIEDQIGAFDGADFIIGPSGAGLTNMIWCRPNTRIIVLHSDHPFKKYPYWDALARVSSSDIHYLSGPRANNVTGLFQAHDDFNIEISTLYNII